MKLSTLYLQNTTSPEILKLPNLKTHKETLYVTMPSQTQNSSFDSSEIVA